MGTAYILSVCGYMVTWDEAFRVCMRLVCLWHALARQPKQLRQVA
jgi:hypothetical protein